jgi:hypothetical protein
MSPPDTSGGSSTTTAIADESTSGAFIVHTDGGADMIQCDPWAQDCARGEKCVAWASDGGSAVNGTRCVPVVRNPSGPGEPCTVQDSATSGLDDCDAMSVCWGLDADLHGTCTEMCTNAENPECPDGKFCPGSGGGVFLLCLTRCDPLALDCPPSWACYPFSGGFGCAPDASPRNAEHGTPCRFVNSCPSGMLCLGADQHTRCSGGVGCCSIICDHSDPLSDVACADADPNQTCVPWYADAPAGYENVGVCAIEG